MTEREKLIVSAYTGVLMCDFDKMHKYVQELLGRPVYTHEFSSQWLWEEIKRKVVHDFIALCESEGGIS